MTAWGIFWLCFLVLFILAGGAIALALKCFEAGRLHERKIVAENLTEIIRLGVDKLLGAPSEKWSKPMRDALRKKMFDQITESGNATRH